MAHRLKLEVQIEQLRTTMYQAYKNSASYDKMIDISQRLDQLLNDLEILKRNKN